MATKVVIAGSRTITGQVLEAKMQEIVDDMFAAWEPNELEVVSGTAKGPDRFGEEWAERNGIVVTRMEADWHKHGRKAGMIRNYEMAKYGDVLVAFWDGKSNGTRNMIVNGLDFMNEIHVYRM